MSLNISINFNSDITTTSVVISWEATDNIGIDYYILKEGNSQIYQGSNTSRTVEGLDSTKDFTFTVEAFDKEGNSSISNVSFCNF